MRVPTSHAPTVVLSSVSAEASTVKRAPLPWGSSVVTVRQQPEHAMDAPMAMVAGS